ncbi:MAG: hypothetical protein JJE17_00545 [Peptostreptococcaceae bacterium]|nr:hypothetical protein [Peptostreptococcaceae bacterium]
METNISFGTVTGAVTFLDVLGWKGIWQRRPDSITTLLNIIDKAKICIEDIKKEHESQNGDYSYLKNLEVEVISISDTIVLLTVGLPETTLELHAKMCSKIIANALEEGILIRGAINYGPFERRENIFVGPAIDEVASWHEIADWIGVIQTPSAYFESINPCGDDFKMIEYDVPLKTKGKILTRCVNWTDDWIKKGKGVLELRDVFIRMGPILPAIYPKYRNTLDFYDMCVKK